MSAADWIDPKMTGVVWTRTSREPQIDRPPLDSDAQADLVIVGAGYTGLAAAIRAAAAGLRVIVVEAGIAGAGASGRNGGYAVPHFPGALRPSAVEKLLGPRKGQALNALVSTGPDRVAELVRRYAIDSDFAQRGWVQPAHSQAALAKVRAVHDDWRAFGVKVDWLDAGAVAAETGAAGYLAGWRNAAGAVVNPLAHARGLARAAESEGARIVERTRVTGIAQEGPGRVILTCTGPGGVHRLQAGKVLIATNAYTDALMPGLPRSVVTVRLYHIATTPLPELLRRRILPNRNCFTDLRKSGGFGRYDSAGRLISGGAVFAAANVRAYGEAHARRRMAELFPQLRGQQIGIEDYWEGYCALTDSYLPHVQRLQPDVFAVLGFSTRGVALTQTIGQAMGDMLAGKCGLEDVPLEVVDGLRRIPFQPLKTAVGRQIFPLYQMKDRLGLS
ncbi:MAG: FAD-dependent oxidoreductase [Gemmobacter sp.]|nr:FAD-dependent oxidoreductase [Gemmobacter sp.]